MTKENYYWNQPVSKVIPMRKLKQNYIKEVERVNLNDLKTKYAMIIITQWNKDSDGSGEVNYALKYMNGKYWMRISGEFVWDSVKKVICNPLSAGRKKWYAFRASYGSQP